MARVTYVKHARARTKGGPRRCTNCHTEIKLGDPYKWFANRIGRMSMRKDYCASCVIRPSMMTTSPHLATIYAAQEAAEDALDALERDTLSTLADILTTCAEGYREAHESYTESADNIEDGFGHETSMSEEIREKAEACETAADELDSAAQEIEGLDDPDETDESFKEEYIASGEYEGELDDQDEPVDKDSFDAELREWAENVRDERWDAAIEQARDAISEGVQI